MYIPQGSSIGKCRGCGQRHELHTGGYCEDCIREKELYIETNPSKEGGNFSEPSGDTNTRPQSSAKRDSYLEYIVSNATDEFIEKVLDDWKADMRSSMGWVDELKKETEDLKLMRIAASLGMGKKPQYVVAMDPATNKEDNIVYIQEEDNDVPNRKSVKRTTAKKTKVNKT